MTRHRAKPVKVWQLRISGPFHQSSVSRLGTQRDTSWLGARLLLGCLTVVTLLTAIVVVTGVNASA
jgi:hypothetical protein